MTKKRRYLTEQECAGIMAAVAANEPRKEIAKRFGIHESLVYSTMKRAKLAGLAATTAPAPVIYPTGERPRLTAAQLKQLNQDILNNVPEEELKAKYNVSDRVFAKAEKPPVRTYTPDQLKLLIPILGRVAERHPEVFAELGIMEKLARHPHVLLDAML